MTGCINSFFNIELSNASQKHTATATTIAYKVDTAFNIITNVNQSCFF